MKISFVKMHGAGNDFVMVDDRAKRCPVESRDFVAALAQRPDGVGCEGVVFVRPSERADFLMRFFNPDGSEADLCGNGARCVAAFAWRQGIVASSEMRFETRAGILSAWVESETRVRVEMPDPQGLREDFVCEGVPHAIVTVEDLASCDVAHRGREIRFSERFAPQGANVDFVTWNAPHEASMRTYERGVEAESFACGTGATAVALVGVGFHGLSFPVRVTTSRGDILEVRADRKGSSFSSVTLSGPVREVFTGDIDVKGVC